MEEEKKVNRYIVVSLSEIALLGDVPWLVECELIFTKHGFAKHGRSFLVPEERYNEITIQKPERILT